MQYTINVDYPMLDLSGKLLREIFRVVSRATVL